MTDPTGFRAARAASEEGLVCSGYDCAVSVIVVSFNTRDLLRKCLTSLREECTRLPEDVSAEILVVDNGSRDGSADMVAAEFSGSGVPVRLIRSDVNLGFGVANNRAIEAARGRYPVLLNSDAFFHSGAFARALAHMETDPTAGVGGARLVGRDGAWQPAARMFPTVLQDAFVLTGLASRFPRSHFFSAAERTWADPAVPAEVDWVTGAFMILRREALAKAGLFDPAFFLYCEEVDLCRRVKRAGFHVRYWPDIVVTHLHGESSRQVDVQVFSENESQVVLWRMRSTLLYYRKHHGAKVWLARWLEEGLYALSFLRNRFSRSPARRERAREAVMLLRLLRQAWKQTRGGRVSPPRPW
ncbi:MAG: glycosyltransferase family 2 protein [Terracidiphilus sp.]|nr:glycosyltransferase family 2 protein [Terracidiphilus sp.]MDR3798384.1 glycosyltransferase family 2 protein [Terracidiphilus sp.]